MLNQTHKTEYHKKHLKRGAFFHAPTTGINWRRDGK
nr:MAG TPA: hypothetical protein [Caudoviricetes sp.]